MYKIKLTNGEEHLLNTVEDVHSWYIEHKYTIEVNTLIYGIKNTIIQCGHACLYKITNTSDMADGKITLVKQHFPVAQKKNMSLLIGNYL